MAFSFEERAEALAKYLDIPADEMSEGYEDYIVETPDGEEYAVVDYDEARELAEEDIRNCIDEMGLEAFSPDFQEWIKNNALDQDWFEEACRESYSYYVEDIESEGSSEFDNRLIEEMYEKGILTDDDFESDDDGEPDHMTLKDDVDIDSKKEEFIESLVDSWNGDFVGWYDMNFGDTADVISRNPSIIDTEAVVDACIEADGIAHFVARYDSQEIELQDDLYAYRID